MMKTRALLENQEMPQDEADAQDGLFISEQNADMDVSFMPSMNRIADDSHISREQFSQQCVSQQSIVNQSYLTCISHKVSGNESQHMDQIMEARPKQGEYESMQFENFEAAPAKVVELSQLKRNKSDVKNDHDHLDSHKNS